MAAVATLTATAVHDISNNTLHRRIIKRTRKSVPLVPPSDKTAASAAVTTARAPKRARTELEFLAKAVNITAEELDASIEQLLEEPDPEFEAFVNQNQDVPSSATCASNTGAQMQNINKLGRPALVLDLDHTLLHSVRLQHLLQQTDFSTLESLVNVAFQYTDVFMLYPVDIPLDDMGIDTVPMWTKLRPGVHEFLQQASQDYDLYVCTMGTRAYAREMCKLLDPSGQLFCGRVMSREDFLNPKFKDLHCFNDLKQINNLAIVDDTPTVWSADLQQKNLLQIQKYIYFPSSSVAAAASCSLLESWIDVEDGSVLLNILKALQERLLQSAI